MATENKRQQPIFIGHSEAEYFAGTVAMCAQGANHFFVETYRYDGARADARFFTSREDAEREFRRQARNAPEAIAAIR